MPVFLLVTRTQYTKSLSEQAHGQQGAECHEVVACRVCSNTDTSTVCQMQHQLPTIQFQLLASTADWPKLNLPEVCFQSDASLQFLLRFLGRQAKGHLTAAFAAVGRPSVQSFWSCCAAASRVAKPSSSDPLHIRLPAAASSLAARDTGSALFFKSSSVTCMRFRIVCV